MTKAKTKNNAKSHQRWKRRAYNSQLQTVKKARLKKGLMHDGGTSKL